MSVHHRLLCWAFSLPAQAGILVSCSGRQVQLHIPAPGVGAQRLQLSACMHAGPAALCVTNKAPSFPCGPRVSVLNAMLQVMQFTAVDLKVPGTGSKGRGRDRSSTHITGICSNSCLLDTLFWGLLLTKKILSQATIYFKKKKKSHCHHGCPVPSDGMAAGTGVQAQAPLHGVLAFPISHSNPLNSSMLPPTEYHQHVPYILRKLYLK